MSKKNNKGFSNVGFILAAIGSAVGLGNLWLFPTALISYGGIAFLIPYLVALVTLGLPFFVLESTLGNKWRRSPVIGFKSYWKTAGPIFGCLQGIGQFIIGTFYVWIIAWVGLMFFTSFTSGFGSSFTHFDDKILGFNAQAEGVKVSADNMYKWGTSFWSLIAVLIVLTFAYLVVNLGIKRGVELANRIMIPTLFLLLIGFFIYSFTIDGFELGVEAVFKPDFSKLGNFRAWSSAFGKAIFSLSLVSAIIMIYSSYAPKDRDNTTQAFIIISGDTLVAILGGFIVASTLGGMMKNGLTIDGKEFQLGTLSVKKGTATTQALGATVKDWTQFAIFDKSVLVDGLPTITDKNIGGSTLIFKTFPVFFRNIGERAGWNAFGNILGVLFFLSAVFAGLSSLIGEVEVGTAILKENTGMKRSVGSLVTVLIQFFFGIFFIWNANRDALYDITSDTYITWMLLALALQQALMFATKPKAVYDLVEFNNKHAKIKWNKKLFYGLVVTSLIAVVIIIIATFLGAVDFNYAKYSNFQWIFLAFCFFVPLIVWTVGILWYKKSTNFVPAPIES